jgi:hypothetical protein
MVVGGLLGKVALRQPHALAVYQIDGGNYFHVFLEPQAVSFCKSRKL